MNIQNLIKESKSYRFGKGRKLIKPFGSFDEIWLLLNNIEFEAVIDADENFNFFIRKKLFWILDLNHDATTQLKFKEVSQTEQNTRLVAIADQVLLTYFEEDLNYLFLEGITYRKDPYNSLSSYRINSARGTSQNASQN